MSNSSDFSIDYPAQLARLELSSDEASHIQDQIQSILGYVAQLSSVNTDNVEPTAHPIPFSNVWEPDAPKAPYSPEQAMANAPEHQDNQFSVPKVVE